MGKISLFIFPIAGPNPILSKDNAETSKNNEKTGHPFLGCPVMSRKYMFIRYLTMTLNACPLPSLTITMPSASITFSPTCPSYEPVNRPSMP